MDTDPPVPPSSIPKKLKFTPKAPPRRTTGPVFPKKEAGDDGEADQALLRKLKERLGTRERKVENKPSGNVAQSDSSGSSVRTYGQPKDENDKKSNTSNLKDSSEKSIVSSSSTSAKDGDYNELVDDVSESSINTDDECKKPYKEPWDHKLEPPISLPLRRPSSVHPVILDKEEFGEEKEHDENINSALELGLLENNKEEEMIFFQFPPNLPFDKQTGRVPVNAKGKEKAESSSSLEEDVSNRSSSFKELPTGHMGKMLVYKSGAIKLKLGDTIFNVWSGTARSSPQDVVMMNAKRKECCVVGQVNKSAVVTPDLTSILDDMELH